MPFDFKARPVRQRVWTAGRLLVLAAALAVTFGVFFLAAMRVATRAREVTVPDLRGKSVADAKILLSSLGLVLKVDPVRRPDPKVPADHVMTQEPEAGTVLRRQRAVRVRASEGQREPVVSAVVGRAGADGGADARRRARDDFLPGRDQISRLPRRDRRRAGSIAEDPRHERGPAGQSR